MTGLNNSLKEVKDAQATILENIQSVKNETDKCSNNLNQNHQVSDFEHDIKGFNSSLSEVKQVQKTILEEIENVKNKTNECKDFGSWNQTCQKKVSDLKNDVTGLNSSLSGMKQVQGVMLAEIEKIKNETTCQVSDFNYDMIGFNNTLSEIKQVQYFILQEIDKVKNGTHNNSNQTHREKVNEMDCKKMNYTFEMGIGCHKIYTTDDWKVNKNWLEAREICRKDGADLAIVNSEAEAEHLGNMMGRLLTFAWIGIHEKNNEWLTVDGKPVGTSGYDQWYYQDGTHAPMKNECLIFMSSSQRRGFNNIDCGAKLKGFICEK